MRTQKRMAVALSVASIFAGGTALVAGAATASTPTANKVNAAARHGTTGGALGTTNLLQRCRWVRGRWVCEYGRDYGRERGRWGRDRDRWDRGRDWDRGRWDRGRDRDWDWD